MWTYQQPTGNLLNPDGKMIAIGYSGYGEGKNNPAMQEIADVGPIPRGLYTMQTIVDENGEPIDHVDQKGSKLAKPVIRLIPDPANQMFDRDGFLIHGDSFTHMGQASLGCIVEPHDARVQVHESSDKQLEVV